MSAAASWTAVTSEAIHRFRAGESEGSGLPNNLVPCQKRQLRLPSLGSYGKTGRLRCRTPRPGGRFDGTLSVLANAMSRNSRFILLFRVIRRRAFQGSAGASPFHSRSKALDHCRRQSFLKLIDETSQRSMDRYNTR